MKLIWVGIALLVATVSVGVGCGPKEKYCYEEGKRCSEVAGAIALDAAWEAPPPDAMVCMNFTVDGGSVVVPCE